MNKLHQARCAPFKFPFDVRGKERTCGYPSGEFDQFCVFWNLFPFDVCRIFFRSTFLPPHSLVLDSGPQLLPNVFLFFFSFPFHFKFFELLIQNQLTLHRENTGLEIDGSRG